MKDENYITIQGWMINKLNLSGNELVLYAIIYGFSQDGKSEFKGGQRYLAKACNVHLTNVNKIIARLVEYGFIEKTGKGYKTTGVSETLTPKVLAKRERGVSETLTESVSETLTDNNIYNNINNNIADVPSATKKNLENPLEQITEIIKHFADNVDPKNKRYYGNKTQREACDFLITHYGYDMVIKVVDNLNAIRAKVKYVGPITTPYQLVDKWQILKSGIEEKRKKENSYWDNQI